MVVGPFMAPSFSGALPAATHSLERGTAADNPAPAAFRTPNGKGLVCVRHRRALRRLPHGGMGRVTDPLCGSEE